MGRKLVVFDADGVILNNFILSAFADILIVFGLGRKAQTLNDRYKQGKEYGVETLSELASLYRGLKERDLIEVSKDYCQTHITRGSRELILALRKTGVTAGIISCSPQFVLDQLKELLGLDFAIGTILCFNEGTATGGISRKINGSAKAEILRAIMEEQEVEGSDLVVVGDSLHDVQMGKLGTFVAFQPKDNITRDAADLEISDLRQFLNLMKYGVIFPDLIRQA